MSWPAFVGSRHCPAAIWAALFLGLGWAFADQIQQVLELLSTLGVAGARCCASPRPGIWRCATGGGDSRYRAWASSDVAVEELRALIDAGRAPVIVDVRSDAARSIDERRVRARSASTRPDPAPGRGHPPDTELVLYCNCPNEASAAQAAAQLARGFTRARAGRRPGGVDASGHEVEASGVAACSATIIVRMSASTPSRGHLTEPSNVDVHSAATSGR